MPFQHTSFHVGDYEVSATFSESHNPAILHNVRQILLSSVAGAEKHTFGDILENASKPQYIDGGEHHRVP